MQTLENVQDLLKLAGIKESTHKDEDVDEGNLFTGNLKKAREEGKDEADLDGDGDLEKVQKEGQLTPTRKMTKWARPEDEPAYRRRDRGEMLDLDDLGINEPDVDGPRGEEIPAYIRRQQGKNFPAKLGESQQLDECGMSEGPQSPVGSMSSMAQEMEKSEGRLNISSNFDSESGRKSLTITAEGDRAEELAQLLKLSGMMGGESHRQEIGESYANEPNPKMMSLDQMLNSGNDLHKKKNAYPKAEDGDNPRAVKKDKVKESLEQRLWAEFQREKAR